MYSVQKRRHKVRSDIKHKDWIGKKKDRRRAQGKEVSVIYIQICILVFFIQYVYQHVLSMYVCMYYSICFS